MLFDIFNIFNLNYNHYQKDVFYIKGLPFVKTNIYFKNVVLKIQTPG